MIVRHRRRAPAIRMHGRVARDTELVIARGHHQQLVGFGAVGFVAALADQLIPLWAHPRPGAVRTAGAVKSS